MRSGKEIGEQRWRLVHAKPRRLLWSTRLACPARWQRARRLHLDKLGKGGLAPTGTESARELAVIFIGRMLQFEWIRRRTRRTTRGFDERRDRDFDPEWIVGGQSRKVFYGVSFCDSNLEHARMPGSRP